jgi:hypothetical protein
MPLGRIPSPLQPSLDSIPSDRARQNYSSRATFDVARADSKRVSVSGSTGSQPQTLTPQFQGDAGRRFLVRMLLWRVKYMEGRELAAVMANGHDRRSLPGSGRRAAQAGTRGRIRTYPAHNQSVTRLWGARTTTGLSGLIRSVRRSPPLVRSKNMDIYM